MADEFNDDEKVPPSWLNKDFFEMVLRNYEKDDTIEISDIQFTPGSAKSDHFSSIMFRVVTEYSSSSMDSSSRSMIVKTIPEVEGFKKELLEEKTFFETEIGMYTTEVPKFEELLRKHGDHTQLCAKTLYCSLKPYKVIVFEDLVPLGYACVRDRLVNVDEVKACLSKIAKWHAASYKLASEGDESVKNYTEGLLTRPKAELPPFITTGMQYLADSMAKLPGLDIYADKLKALSITLIDRCNGIFNAHRRGHKALMVLNHGDLHGRNVMFKYDGNGKLEDVMLIDFQISCYAPAVVDIAYSIYLLFTDEMRQNHREELIYYYFSIFLETLKKIEYSGELPTLADFYIDLYRYREYELWVMSTFLPLGCAIVSSKGKGSSAEYFASVDAQRRMYLNPDFIKEMEWQLPRMLYNGFLD